MLRPLTISDPALLGVINGLPPAPIDTADANTWLWFKATDLITNAATPVIGDKMDATTNKTSSATPNMNLFRYAPGASEWVPYTGADNRANFFLDSDDILSAFWAVSGATKNTSTTFTFTASGGYLRQQQYWCADQPGVSYTFKFKARNISGNANISVYHFGSASGNTTALALTGVLTEYTVTFLAPAAVTAAFYIGFQDNNGAGFGQIEVQDMMLYRTGEHSGVYLDTGAFTQLPWPKRLGVGSIGCGFTAGAGGSIWGTPQWRTNAGGLMTVYAAAYVRGYGPNGYIVAGNSLSMICGINVATGKMRGYVGGWSADGADSVPTGQWVVLTWVFNGASSKVRLNKNAESTLNFGALGVISRIGLTGDIVGGTGVSYTEFHEVIVRYTADNTATQDTFIDYLMGQVGI